MRFGLSAMAAAVLSSLRGHFGFTIAMPDPVPLTPTRSNRIRGSKRIRQGGRTYKPNGQREVARRLRQIAEGRLTASNGLIG
ncbi:hypothetical protein G3A39_39535 [Paraburkholderia aspalathi]|nr:hypothetical protein [Paraburkholderia aspalathi]